MQFYTYLYIDPKFDKPVYVGKGKDDRAFIHFKKKTRLGNLLRKRLVEGYSITPTITYHKDEMTALAMEIFWIAVYGREDLNLGTLFNKTNGGEGSSGYKHTSAHKEKMSKIHTGNTHVLGKKFTDDVNAKKARRGPDNAFFGKTHTEETKKHLSDVRKGVTPWNKGTKGNGTKWSASRREAYNRRKNLTLNIELGVEQ